MSGEKILIVEDEGIEALDLQQKLTSMGYVVTDIVSSGEEAVKSAQGNHPDLVLMDIMLQGEIDGISAAEQIRDNLNIPVIYTTAYADKETLQRAKATGPYGYIVKPLRERELYISIDMALYKHKMELKLRESERRFAVTLKSIGDAVIATDKNGRITFMNAVAEEMLGWKLEEVLDKSLNDVFKIVNMHTRKPAENPVAKVLLDGSTVGLANHTLLITRYGQEIPIDDSAAPIKDDRGNIDGIVLVFRNVKERIETELALRESEERYRQLAEILREADNRKNEFLAVLSHELRNPLAAIHISLSVLERANPCSEQAKMAQDIMRRQVGQLSKLVDELLDITRITRNKIRLQLEQVELNELVQQTIVDNRPLFEENGVQLESDLGISPIFLRADRARLVQVIGNLLQNAAKFTGNGGKTRVSIEKDELKQQAIIRVTDTGVGIEPAMLSRLFVPFMQADTTLDRSKGGLGLGLALSKGLIELHGGEITAYSDGKDKGTEFVIFLPLEKYGQTGQPQLPQDIPGQRRRVLIVDDNADMAESLCKLLELSGHEVAVAYDGREGIVRARQFRPEVILCDIGLPNLNGYEVARVLRQEDELKDILLVAITGYALPEDLSRSGDAGFDCHLPKPVDLTKLKRIMAQMPKRETHRPRDSV